MTLIIPLLSIPVLNQTSREADVLINLNNTRYNSLFNILFLMIVVILIHFLVSFIYHLFLDFLSFTYLLYSFNCEDFFMTARVHTTIPIPTLAHMFFIDKIMPCCGKERRFFLGPRGGHCINVKCCHCGQKWNICPPHYIEKI